MNLVLVSIDDNIFDEHSYARARMREYATACEQLDVVCVTRRVDAQNVQEGALSIHPIAGKKFSIPFLLFKKLRALIQERGRTNTLISSQDPFFAGLVSLVAARMCGVPLHVQVHVAFFSTWYKREDLKHRLMAILAGFVLPQASRVRTVSEKISAYCRDQYHIPADRIDTIPLLVDLNRIRESAGNPVPKENDLRDQYPQFGRIILMACRLTPQKNIPLALSAFKKVLVDVPDAGLVIVGRGELEEDIRTRIAQMGLTESVVLIPWSNDVPSLMRSSDAFLISSDYEGYVMTSMEASACGLPIVMTDVGGAGEFVTDEVNGLVVPVRVREALANALIRVLSDDALRARLAEGGVEQARLLPDFATYRTRIVSSWSKALNPGSGLRMLFITEAVDRTNLALSFTHTWIERLSKEAGAMTVITLNRGDYHLPGVEVLSLGKESGKGRLTRIYRVFVYAWTRRHAYDVVFIHLAQEYAILAGWLWRLMGKRVYLWRNHYAGSWKTDVAAAFCTKVFCTSHYSYTAKYNKTVFMPVGVDTARFLDAAHFPKTPRSILFFARITPSKRVELFIDALGLLLSRGISFVASVYGPVYPSDEVYSESLNARAESLGLHDRVRFHTGVPNDKAPAIFGSHEIFVNCSPSGMFDKMLFEAAASGCLVAASSKDFERVAGSEFAFIEGDTEDLSRKLESMLEAGEEERTQLQAKLRAAVEANSLTLLIERIVQECQ